MGLSRVRLVLVLSMIVTYACTGDGASDDARGDIRKVDLLNATLPVGTCGDDEAGWGHGSPISLQDGNGSARQRDGDFDGASVGEARVVGYADLDGDGTDDGLMSVRCFGSLPENCCAGRASLLTFALPLGTGDPNRLELVGAPIMGGAHRRIDTIVIDGVTVVTTERVIYPEGLTEAELGYPPDVTVTATYKFMGGRWATVSERW